MPLAFPSDSKLARASRLAIAGAAVVGAGLFALNAPTVAGPLVQHRDVQLVNNDEADWALLLATTTANFNDLQDASATASTTLSSALAGLGNEFGGQISGAFSGFGQGIDSALTDGWWAKDDGFVFGIFGGTLTSSPTDGSAPVTETGSLLGTLSTDLQDGQALQAFTALDTWSLELLDHTLKPLLAPILDETSHGVTTYSIPVELSSIQTHLLEVFTNYNTELKPAADALLAPFLSIGFGLSSDIQNITNDLAGADYTQAMTDLNNIPSDLIQDFLNGYPAGSESFPALLADGGLLQELLVTWPTQLANVLTEPVAAATAESVSATLPDLFSGLF